MKTKLLVLAMMCTASFSTHAISERDKAEMMSLINDASPYVVGMGKSVDEVCSGMANDMVKKYGYKLSDAGKSPSEIRDSASGICLDAASSAYSAQSIEEVSMWKKSALQNVNQTFHGKSSAARDFLEETIANSEKMAKPIAFMMGLNKK